MYYERARYCQESQSRATYQTFVPGSVRIFQFRVTVITSADVGPAGEELDCLFPEYSSSPSTVTRFSAVARLGSSYGSRIRLNSLGKGYFFDPPSIHNGFALELPVDGALPVNAPVMLVTATETFASTGAISGKQALTMPRSGSRAVQTRTSAAVYGKSVNTIFSFATMRSIVIMQMLWKHS